MAFKSPLIEQAEGSLLLGNAAVSENLVDLGVEVALVDVDISIELASFAVSDRLDLLQLFESRNLSLLLIAQMKMFYPLRLARQNQLGRPGICFAFSLRSG